MEIISRKEALSRGLKRYFTGKPCKHGHVAERSIYSGCVECSRERKRSKKPGTQGRRPISTIPGHKVCPACKIEKPLDDYHRHKLGWSGRASKCKLCVAKLARARTDRGWNKTVVAANRQTIGGRASLLKRSIKLRCKKSGTKFDLSTEWLIEKLSGVCEATGIPFALDGSGGTGKTLRSPWSPSVDRIDPGGPYTEENCRVVVLCYNQARADWGCEAVEYMARAIVQKMNATQLTPSAVL